MKQMKRLSALFLVLCLLATLLPTVSFATTTASGTCGDNLTWILDDAGTLTISGIGNMDFGWFNTVPWYNYRHAIKRVVINNGVTSISYSAFEGCEVLTSVIIPESITSVKDKAFRDCSNLTSVYITNLRAWCNIEFEGNYFGNCSANPLCYGGNLFINGEMVTDLVIPGDVTHIEDNTFFGYEGLTSISLPRSITSIGEDAFSFCHNLTSVYIEDISVWCNIDFVSWTSNPLYPANGNLYVDNGLVTELVIPEGVTEIVDCAFSGCGSIASVAFSDSVSSIGENAFFECEALTSVEIGNNVRTIKRSAFSSCIGLTNVTIPDSVTSIDGLAFAYCDNLEGIWVDEDNANYSSSSDGILFNKTKSALLFVPAEIKGVYNIPESVTTIGEHAFSFCSGLTEIKIPNGVTTIGDRSFEYCDKLTSITIPEGVTTIGREPFYGCNSLTTLSIPNSITDIGIQAFDNCYNLTYNLYDGAKYLGNVSNPYVLLIEGPYDSAYCQVHQDTKIIYERAFGWSNNLLSVTIPEGIISIGNSAFSNCNSLQSITIPESVISIGEGAFYYCPDLSTVFYNGTEKQRSYIDIKDENTDLINAEWKYAKQEPEFIFADINTTSWQYNAVEYAVARSLMAGKGTDADGKIKFDPNNSITREEFVQVLYNAEGKPPVTIENPFPDVKNDWYKNAILWANQAGIASGLGNGNFGVGMSITRQDLSMMLYKYAKLKGCSLAAEEGKINQFADGNKVANYAKVAMDWAVTNGVLSGKGEAGKPISTFKLDPAGTATRAECAAMLKNFMEVFGL